MKKWIVRMEITDLDSLYTRAQIRQIFQDKSVVNYVEAKLDVTAVQVFDPSNNREMI